MIHIIDFIIKGTAVIILFLPIASLLMLLSLIFWDKSYIAIGSDILEKIL